jgi:hypothetical protein
MLDFDCPFKTLAFYTIFQEDIEVLAMYDEICVTGGLRHSRVAFWQLRHVGSWPSPVDSDGLYEAQLPSTCKYLHPIFLRRHVELGYVRQTELQSEGKNTKLS